MRPLDSQTNYTVNFVVNYFGPTYSVDLVVDYTERQSPVGATKFGLVHDKVYEVVRFEVVYDKVYEVVRFVSVYDKVYVLVFRRTLR